MNKAIRRLATCEICGEDVLEGQGNIMMTGFRKSHCIHIIHQEDNYADYINWHNTLLPYHRAG